MKIEFKPNPKQKIMITTITNFNKKLITKKLTTLDRVIKVNNKTLYVE